MPPGRGGSQLKGLAYGHDLSLSVLSLESNHENPRLVAETAQIQSNRWPLYSLGTPEHSELDHTSPSELRHTPPRPIRCTLLSRDVFFWSHLFWPWDPLPLCSNPDIQWSLSLTLYTKGKGEKTSPVLPPSSVAR